MQNVKPLNITPPPSPKESNFETKHKVDFFLL